MFTYVDFSRSQGGVEAACERIPNIPAIYAFFRRIPDLGHLPPDLFARQVEELIGMPAAPHHHTQAGPLNRITLEARSTLPPYKQSILADVSLNPAFRLYLSEILQHATLLQAPLYVGKAQALQARVAQHIKPDSDLNERLRTHGTNLDRVVLAYAEVNALTAPPDDTFLFLIEDIVTRICRPGFVLRIG